MLGAAIISRNLEENCELVASTLRRNHQLMSLGSAALAFPGNSRRAHDSCVDPGHGFHQPASKSKLRRSKKAPSAALK
jgi:hypothetical protein